MPSQTPQHRYWLCKRCENGDIIVQRCLNEIKTLDHFDGLCDDGEEGNIWPTLTVFRESQNSREEFRPVHADTILVFCKMFKPPHKDLLYVGHTLLNKTMLYPDFLGRIKSMTSPIYDEGNYSVYLEEGKSPPTKIGHADLTVEQVRTISIWKSAVSVYSVAFVQGHV